MRKTRGTQAAWGSWRVLLKGAFLPVLLATGCAGMSNTDRGAIGGTAIGAGTGAVIGHALGNTGAGAAIGGGLGLLTGAAIGNDIDRKEEKRAVEQAAAQQAAQQAEAQRRWPSLAEVQRMSASGTNDAIIINEIRTTGAVYQLSTKDILWLQQNGVHDAVIAEMQATATRPPVVYRQGAVVQPGVVIVEDRPLPPPVVGVRFGYGYWRHW
jgi:Glycine zipper